MSNFLKNKTWIGHLITLAIFISVILLFIRPFTIDIGNNSQKLFETKRDLKFIKEKSDKINSIRDYYRSMEPDLNKISAFFVDSKTPIDLIKSWEAMAKIDGLNIDISSYPLEKEDAPLWPSIGFQIKVSGRFSDVMKFLERIESSQYFIEVRTLSVIKSDIKTGEGSPVSGVSASLGLKIYTK